MVTNSVVLNVRNEGTGRQNFLRVLRDDGGNRNDLILIPFIKDSAGMGNVRWTAKPILN